MAYSKATVGFHKKKCNTARVQKSVKASEYSVFFNNKSTGTMKKSKIFEKVKKHIDIRYTLTIKLLPSGKDKTKKEANV